MSSEEIEVEARRMGWLPLEEFKGREENWKPADQYVSRGKEFIPILRAENKKLSDRVESTTQEIQSLKSQLAEATEAIEALKTFKTEMHREKVVEQRDQLVSQIKEAREEGNVEREVQLQDKLAETREALKAPVKPAPEPEPKKINIEDTQEWRDFITANPWFKEDPVKAAAANAIGAKLAAAGELSNLTQAERLAKIAKATKEYFQMDEEPVRQTRVSSSRGGATGGSQISDDQSFDNLPADVKEGSRVWEKILVGPGKAHKDLASFRTQYAAEYHLSQLPREEREIERSRRRG